MRSLALFALLFFLSANVRAANPPSDEVKAQVRKATGEYNLGQYLDAARDYEAAYLQTLDANLLFNVAQAYRLAGETDKGITAYRSYLRSNPRGDQRALAETKLRELEEKRASAPVAPTVPVAPATAPAPAVTPPHAPSTGPAPIQSTTMVAAPRSNQTNVLIAAPSSEPPKSDPFYKHWPFWVATGVVVAGGVVAVVLLSSRGDNLKMPSATLGTKEF
jgi:tetratricopeptide (TPR) repeat protein